MDIQSGFTEGRSILPSTKFFSGAAENSKQSGHVFRRHFWSGPSGTIILNTKEKIVAQTTNWGPMPIIFVAYIRLL
jgi:hypothetical protein